MNSTIDIPSNESIYYVLREGKQYGPYTMSKMREGVQMGRLYDRDQIRVEGEESLIRLSSLLEADCISFCPGSVVYASTLSRCCAYILDGIMFGLILLGLVIPGCILAYCLEPDTDSLVLCVGILANVLGVYLLITYFTWGLCSGSTMGMSLLKIKAVTVNGLPIGFGRSLLNWLIFYLSGGLSFLTQPFTGQKQAVQDLISGIVIIKNSR